MKLGTCGTTCYMREQSLADRRIVFDSLTVQGKLSDFILSKQLILSIRNSPVEYVNWKIKAPTGERRPVKKKAESQLEKLNAK